MAPRKRKYAVPNVFPGGADVEALFEEEMGKWEANKDLPIITTNSPIRQEARRIMDGNAMVQFGMSLHKRFDQLTDEELEKCVADYRKAIAAHVVF